MTEDHFTSLDQMLAEAKNAWAAERKALEDRIFALETELALIHSLHDKAVNARSSAEAIGVKLLTQFATVAHVFEEARSMALQVGVDLDGAGADAVARARQVIEAVSPPSKTEQPETQSPSPQQAAPQAGGPETIVAEPAPHS